MRLFRAVAATFALLASADAGDIGVNQVHIAYGDATDSMTISWATPKSLSTLPLVRYGLASEAYVFEGNRLLREDSSSG